MGSLSKQIYRYTRPRAYHHNKNLWPFTRITRASSDEISVSRYEGKMVPLVGLSALKSSMQGETLLTTISPSTRNIDFPPLSKTIPVMGINDAWHLADRPYFSLYTIVDIEFSDRKPGVVRVIVNQPEILLLTIIHGVAKILGRYGDALRYYLTLAEDGCYKTHQPKVASGAIKRIYQRSAAMCSHPQRLDVCSSTDIRQGISDAGTVVCWALQILAWLGSNTIPVSDLDMTNFGQSRFCEAQQERLPSYLATKVDILVMSPFAYVAQVLQWRQARVISFSLESVVPDAIFEEITSNEHLKSE